MDLSTLTTFNQSQRVLSNVPSLLQFSLKCDRVPQRKALLGFPVEQYAVNEKLSPPLHNGDMCNMKFIGNRLIGRTLFQQLPEAVQGCLAISGKEVAYGIDC